MENTMNQNKVYYHLPGLYEFYTLYQVFLPLLKQHREYFYDWCEIGSIYGAPKDCIWSGGRISQAADKTKEILLMMKQYGISARLTFSNSLLQPEQLSDQKCNRLCKQFALHENNGVIVHSDLLKDYVKENYPNLYLVSSTTKVITDFKKLKEELDCEDYQYVVPDFRMNNQLEKLDSLSQKQKDKVEFLCNECCWFGCKDRKDCYENVSRQALDDTVEDYQCVAPFGNEGYRFSRAMENPGFISMDNIVDKYLPMGFHHFKIEGRGLGSAMVLEFLLYYMVKPQYQIHVREAIYLDNTLDLF